MSGQERGPKSIRMRHDLYERVKSEVEGTTMTQADAFDEMMEIWLEKRGAGETSERLDDLEDDVEAMRGQIDAIAEAVGADPAQSSGAESGKKEKDQTQTETDGGATTADANSDSVPLPADNEATDLDDYHHEQPTDTVLQKPALEDAPDAVRADEDFQINLDHLDRDEYPWGKAEKAAICAAVARNESDRNGLKEGDLDGVITDVLGAGSNYPERYREPVTEHLVQSPIHDNPKRYFSNEAELREHVREAIGDAAELTLQTEDSRYANANAHVSHDGVKKAARCLPVAEELGLLDDADETVAERLVRYAQVHNERVEETDVNAPKMAVKAGGEKLVSPSLDLADDLETVMI